jgi:hypothetical protein
MLNFPNMIGAFGGMMRKLTFFEIQFYSTDLANVGGVDADGMWMIRTN